MFDMIDLCNNLAMNRCHKIPREGTFGGILRTSTYTRNQRRPLMRGGRVESKFYGALG